MSEPTFPQTSGDIPNVDPAEASRGTAAVAAAAEQTGQAGDGYDELTVEELKDELRGRTDSDGNALTVSGTKDELVARLRDSDASG